MKRNSYSLGSLMLLTLNAGIGLASIRWALMLIWKNPGKELAGDAMVLMFAGGLTGGVVTMCLSAWNHTSWWRIGPAWIAGVCLGVAAGAQFTAKINWWWLIVVPMALAASAYWVALNRRVKLERMEEAATGSSTLATDPSATPSHGAMPASPTGTTDNPYAPISRS